MQYKSPIPLIHHVGFEQSELDLAAVLRIQKRLLVELDHAGEAHIQVGGQVFTKNDILTLTEELKDPNVLLFHTWIFDNTSLLSLLEKGDVEGHPIRLFSVRLFQSPQFEKFKAYISPFLVQPVSRSISRALHQKDFLTAVVIMQAGELIADQESDQATGKVKHALRSLAQWIESITTRKVNFDKNNFEFIKNGFVDFLNDLPESLSEWREELVRQLINLSVAYQHSQAPFCQEMYLYLKQVKCSDELQNLIASNTVVFDRKPGFDFESINIERYSYFIIFILIIIVRGCMK